MKLIPASYACCATLFTLGLFASIAQGFGYDWDGSSGAQFTNANNWTPAVVPGDMDTATFRLGAVPAYPVLLFEGLFVPVNRTVDRLIVGTNTVNFAGGVLTVGGTLPPDPSETGRGLIIGQTATDVAVVNSTLQGLSTVYATLGSAAGSSGTFNLNTTVGTFNVTGTGAAYDLIVGLFGSGAINVSGGRDMTVAGDPVLGLYAGSTGSVSVSGVGSTWANGAFVYVGGAGSGAIDVTGGARLMAHFVTIATETGSNGDVNVTGPNSTLGYSQRIAVGYRGTGSLDVTAGGSVMCESGYVGYGTNLDGTSSTGVGTALVDGADSNWTIADELFVGRYHTTGTLTISNGGRVTNRTGYIGYKNTGAFASDHSIGTVNVTGSTSLWNNFDRLYVGYDASSDGTLNITSGGRVDSYRGYVGSFSGSTGNVTVDGLNSRWNNTDVLEVGINGSAGTLTVTNNGTVQATYITIYSLGEARGNGTLDGIVQNGGLVSPGTSPGALNIDGSYAQATAGQLLVELAATGFDQLLVSGNATLAGTLQVELLDGFVPSVGQSFTILTAGDVDNDFDMEFFPPIPGIGFDVIYNLQSVVLEVVAAALAGDYNGNGVVDAADYTVWRDQLGSDFNLNGNGDETGGSAGIVDAADYAFWKLHFGETGGGAGSGSAVLALSESPGAKYAAVPEPSTVALTLLGLVTLRRRFTRRGRGVRVLVQP